MKKRETPQALMVLWLQAGPTPCRWQALQSRLSKAVIPPMSWPNRCSRSFERSVAPAAVSAR